MTLVAPRSMGNEYETPIKSQDTTHDETKVKTNSRKSCFIAVGVFITLFFILVAIALAFGVFGYQNIEKIQTSQEEFTSESENNTQLQNEIKELRFQLQQLSNSIKSVSTTLSNSIGSVRSTQSSIYSKVSSVSTSFTSVSRSHSSSIRVLQTMTSNPYRNCIQETKSCIIDLLRNDNRRLFCQTETLSVNRTVSIIVPCTHAQEQRSWFVCLLSLLSLSS